MAFFLTKKAKDDLKTIARYTHKEWGIRQRDNYLKQLDDVFFSLSIAPEKGLKCDYIRLNYRKFWVGRHIVFYLLIDNLDIEIVRILHESMDIEVHLG
ncbi:plasmid stabilization system protein [Belliella baltica DSM 15883]|uniref:Toxin n=1 Tax=Belliella baltica (strain DSM 15883 / CIP 108006 / LMG 21964 / BA134) TaxID=866536 RepID=I3Z2H1_BELBD|nr:type II toxin-antitoxin system RelE/ParE family toxin [Belliella baltica]AFL83439.1 plasmid stabilization system protein [Belliella baltica DSM 15883]